MTKTTFHFDGGKYTIVRDDTTFATEAYRHGEPWHRSFVGDKLFHAMLNEIGHLKEYKSRYDEAIEASNKAGFACMAADEVIRYQESEIERLREYEKAYRELVETVNKVSGGYTRVDA